MKYWIGFISALILTLFTATALAFTPPPAPTSGYVVDQTGKLSTSDIANLNAKIENVKTSTSNEIGILILRNLGDENIEDVTHATFKEWKVGKAGLDNGVLIVLAAENRKIRIQTGKGVEGDLTDLQANDIISNMKPALRSGNYAAAMGLAVDQIGGTIESRKGHPQVLSGGGVEAGANAVQQPATSKSTDSSLGLILLGIPLLGGLLFAIFLMFRNKKEEKAASSFSSFRSSAYIPPAPVTKPSAPSYSTSPSYTRSYTPAPAYTPSVSTSKPKKKSSSSSSSSSYSSSSSSSSSSSYSSGGSSWGGSSDSGSSGGFGGGDSGGGGASSDF